MATVANPRPRSAKATPHRVTAAEFAAKHQHDDLNNEFLGAREMLVSVANRLKHRLNRYLDEVNLLDNASGMWIALNSDDDIVINLDLPLSLGCVLKYVDQQGVYDAVADQVEEVARRIRTAAKGGAA